MFPKFNSKPEEIAKAIEAVHDGLLSITAASKQYEVPRSTLVEKILGRTSR